MKPIVLNMTKFRKLPPGAVYVGRPGKWGNPFSGKPRLEAIKLHEAWVRGNPSYMQQIKDELRGKNLACWCAPLPCHADTLLRIANGDE